MAGINPAAIVETLRTVLAVRDERVSLHEPHFGGNEWAYVKECIDTGWVSSVGKFVDRFERDLAAYTGASHAVAVVNGTAALHICLLLVDVKPGDEVLMPTLTFIATANAVSYCSAIPHFVDSNVATLGMDALKLEAYLADIAEMREGFCFNKATGRRIKAMVPMHTFGHPVDLDPLAALCERYNIALVEDAAESLGSYYKDRHTGNWGRVSALSFNGNKVITTGGGGAILTNDPELGKLAKHLTTTAKVPHKWSFSHDQVGFNYRLPNINAALGCAQLEQLPEFILAKRRLAQSYQQAFSGTVGVSIFVEPEFACSNYWLNALLLDRDCANQRDDLLEISNAQNIMTRPTWTLMHKLDMFKSCPRMKSLGTAEDIERRLINIPSSASFGGFHD